MHYHDFTFNRALHPALGQLNMLHNTLSSLCLVTVWSEIRRTDEVTAHDRDTKWRQMVDGSWPLTPVIRYRRCNWPVVFSINRHYWPLCWPAPLAALLFLEAPGSSRASALTLCIPQVLPASLLSASLHISKQSFNSPVQHAVDHETHSWGFVTDLLFPGFQKCLDQEIYDLSTLLSFISGSRALVFIQRPPDALMYSRCIL